MASSDSSTVLPRAVRELGLVGGFGVLYLAIAELGRSVGPTDPSLLWAPSGLLLGVLLVSGRRLWPAVLCAALAAAFGANLLAGSTPMVSLAFAVPSCAEGFLGALIVLRLTGDRFSLDRVRDIAALVLGAAVAVNGLTALSAAGAAVKAFDVSFAQSWLQWWSADALGIIVVAPIVVFFARTSPRLADHRLPERPRLVEAATLATGLGAITFFLTFAEPLGAATVVGGALGLPLLLWAGWRFSPYGPAFGVLVLSLAATYLAPRTADPFGLGSIPSAELVVVQAFVGALVVASLAFGAAAAERRAAAGSAADNRARLRDLIAGSPAAYVSIDDAGLITEWNPRAEVTFGWSRGEALGRRLQETIVPEAARDQWKEEVERRAGSRQAEADPAELPGQHQTGREVPVELRISPSSPSDLSASHLFIRDVSQRERLRAELQEAQDLVAHRTAELSEAGERAERLTAGLVDRSEQLSQAREELEGLRADLEGARTASEQKAQELSRLLQVMSEAETEQQSLRAELARSQASREEVTERLTGERVRLERALDAMVMSFAEADRERQLLARRSTELIVRYDRRGLCRYASPAALSLLGYDPADLVGQQGADLLHPDDRPALYRARSAKGDSTFGARLQRKDGGLAPVEITFSPKHAPDDGKLLEIEASIRGRDERPADPPHRRVSQARFRTTFAESPVGMALLERDGRIREANPALCRMTGRSREQLESSDLLALVRSEETAGLKQALRELAAGERSSLLSEHGLEHAEDGSVRVSLSIASVTGGDREPLELVAQLVETGEQTDKHDELRRLIDHDPLTGLYSLGRFEQEVRAGLAADARYDSPGAVLVVNLDRFTELNGLLGRSGGDKLIRAVAYAVRQRLRTTDVVGRTGGDQFAVLLPRTEGPQATEVAQALLDAVREAGRAHPSRTLQLTASIGIARFGEGRDVGAEELLVEAEIAVQDAKHAGGDQAVVFDSSAGGAARLSEAGLGWADQIRTALEDGRFVLYAEPVVSLTGDRLPRHELLPRMVAASGEIVPPTAFLPAAERFGLAGDLDRWLLRSAIDSIGEEGRDGSGARVEVALSTGAPADPDLHTFVARELERTGADPAALCLTIAETAAIHGTDRTSLFLHRLADLGCEVGLDRFGAGVASFLHVERLPVGYVKLDAALVDRLVGSQSARLIVKSIADIAQGLGMRTVAASVSDDETLTLLRGLGIGYVQGTALSAARPVTEVQLWRSATVLPG